MQGLAVGGEFTTSIVYVVEHADARHRARSGSWMMVGATSGILLGSAVGALMANLLSAEALAAWGWRVPFLLGIVVAVIGFWLRRRLPEIALPPTHAGEHGSPLVLALRTEWRTILRVILLCLPNGPGFYILFVYIVSYLRTVVHVPEREALDINTLSMMGLVGFTLLGGVLADRLGRKPVALVAMAGLLILARPLFELIDHSALPVMLAAQLTIAALIGLYAGQQAALLVEIMPARVRCTAVAIGYNLSVGLFGGLTPITATWLIHRTGDEMIPAIILMVVAVLGLMALRRTPETAFLPLR